MLIFLSCWNKVLILSYLNFLLCTNKHFCTVFSANIVLSWRYHFFAELIWQNRYFLLLVDAYKATGWKLTPWGSISHLSYNFQEFRPRYKCPHIFKDIKKSDLFFEIFKKSHDILKNCDILTFVRKKVLKSCFFLGSYFNAN